METGEEAGRDVLRIYGFSFEFPAEASLEFKPKFKREEGELAVKVPGGRVFLTWGDIRSLTKSVATVEGHAGYGIERLKKSVKGKVSVLEHSTRDVNGHQAVYNRMSAETKAGVFRAGVDVQEAWSLHLHCDRTGRYFIVSAALSQRNRETQERMATVLMGSLKCH
ncbi:MAG: hypothetical protein KGI38_01765 [Thaumarchaeota archaeon]|nr:hypothetical protein [Nitrososphaerota archaeon]